MTALLADSLTKGTCKCLGLNGDLSNLELSWEDIENLGNASDEFYATESMLEFEFYIEFYITN